jgi:hypothetical protein
VLALPHEHRAGPHVHLVDQLAEALEVGPAEAGEQPDRVEQVELRILRCHLPSLQTHPGPGLPADTSLPPP